ncbi:MAG: ARMT1-like domain-containing protein [Candidatus Omnitrophica bacterium]|nr:ARMT1-like domain-containing protein [Candidatus Omnitrophota bacterium]
MRSSKKCIDCFYRQVDMTAGLLKLSKAKHQKAKKVIERKINSFDFSNPPIVFGRAIYRTLSHISGVRDPFLSQKRRIEKQLLNSMADIRSLLNNSPDPFEQSAKACCAANMIDFGAGKIPDLRKFVTDLKKIKLKVNDFKTFKNKLKAARRIMVLGDNCGEIFFDRLFIEQISLFRPELKIVYVSRSAVIINDATVPDAKRAGISGFARIISSGCDYPGLLLTKTSELFQKEYKKADIVLSKGQGNFESYNDNHKAVFYLFKVKCLPVAEQLRLPFNSLLFIYNKTML